MQSFAKTLMSYVPYLLYGFVFYGIGYEMGKQSGRKEAKN